MKTNQTYQTLCGQLGKLMHHAVREVQYGDAAEGENGSRDEVNKLLQHGEDSQRTSQTTEQHYLFLAVM
jgi:hypothetical protein